MSMKKNTLTMKNFIRAIACLVFVLAGMNTFAQEEIEFVRKSKILTKSILFKNHFKSAPMNLDHLAKNSFKCISFSS